MYSQACFHGMCTRSSQGKDRLGERGSIFSRHGGRPAGVMFSNPKEMCILFNAGEYVVAKS